MTEDSKDKQIDEAVDKRIEEKHVVPRKMLSQAQLAQASGLSTATVNRYIKANHIKGIKSNTKGRTILYSQDILASLMGYKKDHVDTRKHTVQHTVVGALSTQLKQSQLEVASLQEQLKAKDQQIAKQQEITDSLTKQNEKLQELVTSTQALLRQNETIISKHDDLLDEQNKLLRSHENEPKKGFWYRLFH